MDQLHIEYVEHMTMLATALKISLDVDKKDVNVTTSNTDNNNPNADNNDDSEEKQQGNKACRK